MNGASILTESGTNELEIAIFSVGQNVFGINVAKVQSIEEQKKGVRVPNAHSFVRGIINHRGTVLPVIQLDKVLNLTYQQEDPRRQLILAYFNSKGFAFEIDRVIGIRRLSWSEIHSPDDALAGTNRHHGYLTGIVNSSDLPDETRDTHNQIIMILDFEKIIADINPASALKETLQTEAKLAGKTIVVAEDSSFLIKIIESSLLKTGAVVKKFSTGLQACDFLSSVKHDEIFCVVTDVEMPQMDGLTLTRKIKTDLADKNIPVILFSSIVSDTLKHKGESVGADAQITKPEIDQLIDTILRVGAR